MIRAAGETVTIAVAAQLLDMKSWPVRKLAEAGALPYEISARGVWMIPLKAVVEYAVHLAERNALEVGYELGKVGHPVKFAPA